MNKFCFNCKIMDKLMKSQFSKFKRPIFENFYFYTYIFMVIFCFNCKIMVKLIKSKIFKIQK